MPANKPAVRRDAGTAKLTLPDGRVLDLPVYGGTLGPDVVDVTPLKQVDMFTYDPGFIATAACASRVTYIDGDAGRLLYRGHPIEQLAEKATFLEVCHLLYHGDIPPPAKLSAFRREITRHTMVTERVADFIKGFDAGAHPMAVMIAVVGALAAFYHDWIDVKNPESRRNSMLRLVAKMPTVAAMSYKYSIGQPFMHPQNRFGFVENFFHMMFATPCEPYKPDPVLVRALDRIFTLHADHEQNASTSTVRLAGSTNANPFACAAAGIASLWGPAHGGANEAVLRMLKEIGTVENIPAYVEAVKSGESGLRLMGFGHRVYKNFDPRAAVMRRTCREVLRRLKLGDERLRIAMALEEVALRDEYFGQAQVVSERGLLFGDCAARAGDSDEHVHGDLRDRPNDRMGDALERVARGPRIPDRPPAPVVSGPEAPQPAVRQKAGGEIESRAACRNLTSGSAFG